MKIDALRFHNVKRFGGRGVAIEGIGDGVNVLCAANEFGKSTSFEALHGLFFLPHSSAAGGVRNLRPYSGGNPLVETDIAVGEARYRLTKKYYSGGFAKVVDLASGQLIAQADEAENFISRLIQGGAGGPAGLLWVRQGVTGIETRSRTEEESERQVRTSLLESVQGEVEAMTGGRRMAGVIAAATQAAAELVTANGKPKAGGRYATAKALRDRLAEEALQLEREVTALRRELDQRGVAQRRLAELDQPDARDSRKQDIEKAEAAFQAAKSQADRLKTLHAELGLARERRDVALRDLRQFDGAVADARALAEDNRDAHRRRDEAVERRRTTSDKIAKAQADVDAAEQEELAAHILLERLEAAGKAREAAERRAEWEERLRHGEQLRGTIEDCEAQLSSLRLPKGAVDELAELDIEIVRLRAMQDAARPSVQMTYEPAATARVTMAGVALGDGEERGYDVQAQLIAPGLGTIILRSNNAELDDTRLTRADEQRQILLASMGVADLAVARAGSAGAGH